MEGQNSDEQSGVSSTSASWEKAKARTVAKLGERFIRAGDYISYYQPTFVLGPEKGVRQARVLGVNSSGNFPLRVSTEESLALNTLVRWDTDSTGNPPNRQQWRQLCTYSFVQGNVEAPTVREELGAAFKAIRESTTLEVCDRVSSGSRNIKSSRQLGIRYAGGMCGHENEQDCVRSTPEKLDDKDKEKEHNEYSADDKPARRVSIDCEANFDKYPEDINVDLPCHPEGGSFDTHLDAMSAVDRYAQPYGYSVVIKRNKRNSHGVMYRYTLACDRHGKLRNNWKLTEATRKREFSRSRKCDCKMEIVLFLTKEDKWEVRYNGRQSRHNHRPSIKPSSHPTRRRHRRSEAVQSFVERADNHGERAAVTVSSLRVQFPDILVTNRDVYNMRYHSRTSALKGRTKMEYFIQLISNKNYFCDYICDVNGNASSVFVANCKCVNIFKTNCDVVIMDCTYKTNRFGMPCLNIVGCTGMNTTIHLAQCFLRREEEPDFVWALKTLSRLYEKFSIPLPQVIFTDRDEALLNALEQTWSNVPTILCLWHIVKNIKKHAREKTFYPVTNEEGEQVDSREHENFVEAFLSVIYSRSVEEYECNRQYLHVLSPVEAKYIDETWLDIWKWRIVHCWTNSITHFGLHSTSRVEGYHSAMKLWLRNSTCDLLTIHKRMTLWWTKSIEDHEQAVDIEATRIMNAFRKNIYEGVVLKIYSYALKQCELLIRRGICDTICSGTYTKTTGLPCIHKLTNLLETGGSLRPVDFHSHWWIDRSHAPMPEIPRVKQPLSIKDLRALRARKKANEVKAKATGRKRNFISSKNGTHEAATFTKPTTNHATYTRKGSGPNGNRREMSTWEMSELHADREQHFQETQDNTPRIPAFEDLFPNW